MQVSENGNYLEFAGTVWNAGTSPLVVDGFRRDNEPLMDAYQYFFDKDLNQVGYRKIGTMVREVLSSGSGDTYSQIRAGQSFNLKGLANGTYYISVEANPFNRLVEQDTTNNVALRKVVIGGKAGARTVKSFPVGLVDDSGYSIDY